MDLDLSKMKTYKCVFKNGVETIQLFDENGNFFWEITIDPDEQGEIRDIDGDPY